MIPTQPNPTQPNQPTTHTPMTREELKADAKFVEWISAGRRLGFLDMLARLVDTEIGDSGFDPMLPHLATTNMGIMVAVRATCKLLENPLQDPTKAVLPSPSYGVTREVDKE